MMIVRLVSLLVLLLVYSSLFYHQYKKGQEFENKLDYALPATFHKITAGYLKQLAAEMLFIRTSIFLGGVKTGTSPKSYEAPLTNNFQVMTQLYPEFIDPYFFCQGFLSPISTEATAETNIILERGITAHPKNYFLRIFKGTNYFLSMNAPLKGAKVFAEAAQLPNSPPLFGHLSALLSAQGGDITAGIIALKTLLATEKNETIRTRYKEELVIFEQVFNVQSAINKYMGKHISPPTSLEELIPEFLPQLPMINEELFVLVYEPPSVHLQRPASRKKVIKND